MSAPLDQSIVDMLRHSAMGSVVDRPVNDVLRDMGLPGLPHLPPAPPLPQLPPMPVLDMHALTKPITDLASSFGTGKLGAGPGPDPTQVLSQISSVVQTVVQLGSSAMQLTSGGWQGDGATAAAAKSGQAAADGTAVAGQGTQMSTGTTAAAGSVFTGNAAMTGLTARYLSTMAAAAPFAVTPPGQVFMLSMSAETLAEALAVVTKTRVELTGHSVHMAQTGRKVKITNVPHGVSAEGEDSALSDASSPVSLLGQGQASGLSPNALSQAKTAQSLSGSGGSPAQFVSQALQSVSALGGLHSAVSAKPIAGPVSAAPGAPSTGTSTSAPKLGGPGGAGGGPVPTGGPGPSAAGAAEMSSPLESARTPSMLPESASPLPESAAGTSTTSGPGMVPMTPGAAGMSRLASDGSSASEGARAQLVTAAHGNEVVGPIAGISLPVVGAAEEVLTTPDSDNEPPDKALTL